MAINEEKSNVNLADTIKEKAADTTANIGQKYEQMKDKKEAMLEVAEGKAYALGAKSREWMDKGEEQLRQYCHTLEGRVKTHPMLAISAAMATGALLSRLFWRNRH
jgi:ElaB/YqjD/DUF883 family membrane-anchored ribosome-binding protein